MNRHSLLCLATLLLSALVAVPAAAQLRFTGDNTPRGDLADRVARLQKLRAKAIESGAASSLRSRGQSDLSTSVKVTTQPPSQKPLAKPAAVTITTVTPTVSSPRVPTKTVSRVTIPASGIRPANAVGQVPAVPPGSIKAPAVSPSTPSHRPDATEVARMVRLLKGARVAEATRGPSTVIVDRKVILDPKVLPKGHIGPVATPHCPETTGGGSTTLYIKRGKERAEGSGVGPVVHIAPGSLPPGVPGRASYPPAAAAPYPAVPGGSGLPVGSYGGGDFSSSPGSMAPDSLTYRIDSSSQLSTSEVRFLKNSTELADQQSLYYLYNLANALLSAELIGERFVVEGHASAEGSFATNLTLSQRRANAIFDFLVSQGVHPSRLLAVGHGESLARYDAGAPEYLRSTDRRVIVFKLAH